MGGKSLTALMPMPNMTEFKQAIELIEKYKPKHNWLSAEHDVIYFPDVELPEDAKQAYRDLGFHYSSEGDCWAGFV